jgi:membrane-bound lytic murein transglycosylase D
MNRFYNLIIKLAFAFSFLCFLDFNLSSSFAQKEAELQISSKLRPRVNFWIDIFGRYTKAQVIIHHRRFPQVRFALLDVAPATRGMNNILFDTYKDRALKAKLKEVREDIDWLASGQAAKTEQQRNIEQAMSFFGPSLDKYKRIQADPDLVRGQSGIRDKMAEAIERSGRYLGIMEDIFVNEFDLPVELTRLPFVESSFDYKAYSTVTAAGIWQFMPNTAKSYMRLNAAVDERLDPIESTRAAAKYLKSAYARLGTWPLALTSYNHGVAGVLSKVRKFGTADIAALIDNRSAEPPFGFASANFFPSFLAAKEVYEQRESFFPDLVREKSLNISVIRLGRSFQVAELKQRLGVSEEALKAVNYGLTTKVWQGRLPVPSGYNLKVPAQFQARMLQAGLGSSAESLGSASSSVRTDVKTEEVTQPAKSPKVIVATKTEAITKPAAAEAAANPQTYKVKPGDTLHSIARSMDISIADLQSANKLKNSFIYVGKVLQIPSAPTSATKLQPQSKGVTKLYTVKKGDTLAAIAKKNGISLSKIISVNGLSAKKPLIKPGQVLKLS